MAKKTELKKESKELLLTIDSINKDFGPGSIMKLGSKEKIKCNVISTGSINLNLALGIGGLPYGRVCEIFGAESSGKTTIAMHVIAEAQKAGGTCAIIDAEFAFDPTYATSLGIDVDELYISQPSCTEEGLEICDRLVESGKFNVIVVDSVAALVPKKELEGEVGDSAMGLQARLMSQVLRKITGKISKTNTLVIFINQIREKIGVMFGNPETTTGGRSLAFYASIRLDIRKTAVIKDGDEAIGNIVKVKVVKNKLSSPFRTAEFNIIYGEGIDTYMEVIEQSVALGVAEKSGSWFSYNGDKLGQGREAVKALLKDNEELYLELKQKVEEKIYTN